MDAAHQANDDLYVYAMGRGRESFILQHVVDAHAAQACSADDKPVRVVFALIGLYLHVEKHFSGRQVQQVHMQLGQHQRSWPTIVLPLDRGDRTAADVMVAAHGDERDRAIDAWCASVWAAFHESRETIIGLLAESGIE